jgi:hypothetical protein
MTSAAPVIVMRWFSGGAGYAYDRQIDDATLADVLRVARDDFDKPPGHVFSRSMADGRLLIGEVQPEANCLDVRAMDRRPVVVRAALLPGPLAPRHEAGLRRALRELPPPQRGGAQTLHVPLPALPACPPPVSPWSRIGSALAGWLGFPTATADELTTRERILYAAESMSWGKLLDRGGWLLLPNGRRLAGPAWYDPEMPIALDPESYFAALAAPGLALVHGRERVWFAGGRSALAPFTRGYVRSRGEWRLRFVQWGAVEGQP